MLLMSTTAYRILSYSIAILYDDETKASYGFIKTQVSRGAEYGNELKTPTVV